MSDSFLSHAVNCSLVDLLDRLLIVQLRDGRKFRGTLITFDQYSNIVLNNSVELLIESPFYAESSIGIQLLRGENIVLLGQLRSKELLGLTLISVEEVKQKKQQKGLEDNREEELRIKEDEEFGLF